LSTNFACLYFELSNKQEKEFVAVDTGDPVGAVLPPAKWRDWKFAHPNQPRTLHAFFMPGSGLVAKEEAWAPEFGFGPVVLTSLPIGEASPSQVALGSPNFGGSLGITALKRCDLIVDGIHAVAYLQPKATRPRANEHNRLGAAFMPADAQSDTLIAQVMQGSPAYEAGMRDGDVLLRIGKMDVSGWRRDPSIKLNNPFRERPAGTKVELALRRGPETYLAKTTLRDILKPESHKR
jgi:hypothetical protein